MMNDQGFPVIRYDAARTPRQWGQLHGEMYRRGIAELVEIRTMLMREKNPGLTTEMIVDLARQQWEATRRYDEPLHQELAGIAEGAETSITDIVILNNYTDFRDIRVPDQGCSVAFVNYGGNPVVGQTWDMHGSAKRYVCCLQVPCPGHEQPAVLFSLVGCLGMMGFHPAGQMVGVNNINTDGARAGAVWPAIVRRTLGQSGPAAMTRELTTAPSTSGHCYLIASVEGGEFWEVMPGLAERVSALPGGENGYLIHTNHCLGQQARRRETVLAQTSTTHIRFELMQKKIAGVRDLSAMYNLMNDHENYPKSICSNFQTNSQDPSITCGGAVGDLSTGRVKMWRGDPVHDDNFVCRDFELGVPHRQSV